MFVAKALEYTLRRVVLLTVNRSVLLQNTVDDIREGGQFRAFRWLASPISRRFRMPQHLPTVSRAMPNRLAASRWLRPSTWQASRTRRYRSTVYILPPSISKKIEGYRWQSFTPPAAGKSRRFRGLICHRRSHATVNPPPPLDSLGQRLEPVVTLGHPVALAQSRMGRLRQAPLRRRRTHETVLAATSQTGFAEGKHGENTTEGLWRGVAIEVDEWLCHATLAPYLGAASGMSGYKPHPVNRA